MFSKTLIAYSAAILLGTAFAASATEPAATTRHHRHSHVQNQPIYNVVPDNNGLNYNAGYPASGAPLRTEPDLW